MNACTAPTSPSKVLHACIATTAHQCCSGSIIRRRLRTRISTAAASPMCSAGLSLPRIWLDNARTLQAYSKEKLITWLGEAVVVSTRQGQQSGLQINAKSLTLSGSTAGASMASKLQKNVPKSGRTGCKAMPCKANIPRYAKGRLRCAFLLRLTSIFVPQV